MAGLFDPITLGRKTLRNRMIMSPCTRNRATMEEVPTELMAEYYGQRATAGMIITEGINPERRGRGYFRVPAAYNTAQQLAWACVASTVHARGGHIFGQLMHCGRLSFPELQPGRERPIAPSAIRPDPAFRGMSYGCPKPDLSYEPPRALESEEIPALIDSFAAAARRMTDAGFDGVEVHAASGYLPMQFLTSNTNLRDDAYGGDKRRRSRFLLDLVDALIGAIGAERVAVKLAPAFRFHDVHDEDPVSLYTYVAYVQVSDFGDYYSFVGMDPIGLIRKHYRGTLIANGGFNLQTGEAALLEGKADAIAFGTGFIANPDLPERFWRGSPLNVVDPSTFYSEGARGYTDYPSLAETPVGAVTTQFTGSRSVDFEAYKYGGKSPVKARNP